jgi:hypothetical protein
LARVARPRATLRQILLGQLELQQPSCIFREGFNASGVSTLAQPSLQAVALSQAYCSCDSARPRIRMTGRGRCWRRSARGRQAAGTCLLIDRVAVAGHWPRRRAFLPIRQAGVMSLRWSRIRLEADSTRQSARRRSCACRSTTELERPCRHGRSRCGRPRWRSASR